MEQFDRQTIEMVSKLEFNARQVVEGFITGLHKSPFHGFSVEFAEHRLYNTGESTRHIDWKLYARTEKLFIKRYEEETNLRCQLIIDQSSSMNYPDKKTKNELTKLEFAVNAAAVLAELFKKQRDAVGISFFDEKMQHIPSKGNASHFRLIYHQLSKIITDNNSNTFHKTSLAKALHEIADILHRRSLVIIFSDMLDSMGDEKEVLNALQHLRYNKHEVILFYVVDKNTELDFNFDNRPYRFVDSESGEEVKVNPIQIKEAYHKAINSFKKELELKCAQYKIDFVEADIKQGYDTILLTYLHKRNKMI
ncbi:MAG: DUF58 domain-containing protein [Bacteroidia bacterium]